MKSFLLLLVQMYDNVFIKGAFPLKPVGKGRMTLFILLNHVVIVEFGPFIDVLLTHNV